MFADKVMAQIATIYLNDVNYVEERGGGVSFAASLKTLSQLLERDASASDQDLEQYSLIT